MHDEDVFALTAKGRNELGGSATSLAPAELEVLVLIDGKSTLAQTAARVRSIGKEAAAGIVDRLLRHELIEIAKNQAGSFDLVDFFQSAEILPPSSAATVKAKKEAAATATLLQERGYLVRIARRAGAEKPAEDPRTLSVLVVEDEQYLAKLLKSVLANEGFDVRTAKSREEIVAELRRPPRPDLVLLDVMLPDIDGFEVLLRIRQHPVLKTVPVVMLTAKATRDAVLKGLAGGADGYITKPFEIPVLVKAVKVVLGLSKGDEIPGEAQDPWAG
ncbi:MAG: response regulator [Burkholderiales bacterium]|nr:response regulator [Burkholderiales bacterium]